MQPANNNYYGMAMNAKKTKTMIVEKTPEKQCEVNVKGHVLKCGATEEC